MIKTCCLALGLSIVAFSFPTFAHEEEPSVYERVIKSGKIRCGYVVYPPAMTKDANTGEVSGIYPDILERVADSLSLEIEWKEEVTWGTLAEGLDSDRYDLFCSAAWPNGPRARVIEFSDPLYFSSIDAYTRKGDTRYKTTQSLNNKDVHFSAIDGSTIYFMTKELFPDARIHTLPELSSHAEMIMDVQVKKADVVLAERSVAHEFSQHNPDTMVRFESPFPLIANPNTMPFKKGEPEFASMINDTIGMLHNQGTIDRILDKYEPQRQMFFYRVAKPYEVSK